MVVAPITSLGGPIIPIGVTSPNVNSVISWATLPSPVTIDMFTKLDSQSLCIYLELLSMKGIGKSILLQYDHK